MLLFQIFLILLGVTNIHAMVAFDCTNPKTNMSVISLTQIGECSEIKPNIEVKSMKVQLIQKRTFDHVYFWQCDISVTQIISHCGMHSHASMVEGGLTTYVEQVSGEACRQIGLYGVYEPKRGIKISNIK